MFKTKNFLSYGDRGKDIACIDFQLHTVLCKACVMPN